MVWTRRDTERLSKLVKLLGSQVAAAKALEVSRATLCRYLARTSQPHGTQAIRGTSERIKQLLRGIENSKEL
jgi:predicted transcriptional regulator